MPPNSRTLLAALALVALSPVANAGDNDWLPRDPCEWTRACDSWRYKPRYNAQRRAVRVVVRYVYRNRDRYDDDSRDHRHNSRYDRDSRDNRHDGGTCEKPYKGVGNQHLTVDGAKQAADEVWAGTIRFHLGEKYMDLANARHIVYTCSRSSIKESSMATLGQTLTRCELEAQPCAATRERK